MGTWSEDTFGNDIACDWIGSFLENPGLPIIENAIQTVLKADGYLNSDEACECLAACEVIARLQGNWGSQNAYSEELDEWIAANPMKVPESLKEISDSAIARILGANSELREIWDEEGRNEAWHQLVDDLRSRMQG